MIFRLRSPSLSGMVRALSCFAILSSACADESPPVDLAHPPEVVTAEQLAALPPHPRLLERIGDYTLLMQDDWTIKDWVAGEQRYQHIGVHGGNSSAEMFVPLIMAQC